MTELRALEIHPEKCTGCKQCELACSWVQVGQFQPAKSLIRVQVFDEQASYAPYACLQCDEAWCMHACPVNAIDVDESTGAKIVIDEVCVGCKLCVIACPFTWMEMMTPRNRKAGSSVQKAGPNSRSMPGHTGFGKPIQGALATRPVS